jgi:hypothetical protein
VVGVGRDDIAGIPARALEDADAGGLTGSIASDARTDVNPRVLVIGLDPHRVPGDWDPEPVAAAIRAGLARFAEHGVGVEPCLVGLDGTDDVPTVVAQALRSRRWECVVIGGGLRIGDDDDQVELFEQIVNLARRHAPQAAIAFNSTPGDTFDAACGWIVTD